MVLTIAGLGLVLLMFSAVRRPEFWNGLFPDKAGSTTSLSSPAAAAVEVEEAVAGLQPDEFLTSDEPVNVTARKIPVTDVVETEVASGLPVVPHDLLRNVRDDVIGVHSTESEAYFTAMKMAARMVEKRSDLAQPGAFAVFMDSPSASRGKAWKISGELRRLSAVKTRSGMHGLGTDTLYDAWLTTRDSGDQLVHVITTSADAALLTRIPTTAPDRTVTFTEAHPPLVSFTGYFFKREAYASRQESGISQAPMFVAGTLHHVPLLAAGPGRAQQLTPWLGWLLLAVCTGVTLMLWSFSLSDMAHSQTRSHQLTKLPAHASFEDVTAVTVMETLEAMESSRT
ncbi:MAG: hypothetical protein R3C49_08380 [Planctomycetaceae bacterium]